MAICDVDRNTLDRKAKQFGDRFKDLKQFQDYRQLLDKMGNDIYAVFAQRRHLPLRIRAFVDFLRHSYAQPDYWRARVRR